ncbi:MAG: hypothetical protein HQL45_15745 [Alphaproteobacteria bacterium]|nr:hypothetical protein [Alphaproteobacteria bacterium]
MTAIRKRLPDRRRSINRPVQIGAITATGTVGFYPDDEQIGEIFLEAGKEGADMQRFMADVATLISIALQYGAPIERLAHSMGRMPLDMVRPEDLDGRPKMGPASPVGHVLDWLLALEAEVMAQAKEARVAE